MGNEPVLLCLTADQTNHPKLEGPSIPTGSILDTSGSGYGPLVINHGVPENLMKAIMDVCHEFFDLPEEEKRMYEPKHPFSPITTGTSFNRCEENTFCWRDFLDIHVRPTFHCPDKPEGFREVLSNYTKATREVALKIGRGISESLGLGEGYLEKVSKQEEGFQLFVSNFYPQCPQPESAMGIAPHTDDAFLNLVIQNGVGGLQLLHNGKWVNVEAVPNSFIVNVGDHMEILSNGKYKSVLHRATVNRNRTRMSIASSLAPALDVTIEPAPELVNKEISPPAYRPIKYGDYLKAAQRDNAPAYGLDFVKINN